MHSTRMFLIKNLLVIIFLALSLLLSVSCDNSGFVETETTFNHHRCRRRRHYHHHSHSHSHSHRKHHKCRKRKPLTGERPQKMFNVDDFGAKGDGITDDSLVFQRAWNKFCKSSGATLIIPSKRTYMLSPTQFNGPCNPNLKMKLHGTIKASGDKNDYKNVRRQHWLKFNDLRDFMVDGGGVFDGNGLKWWKESCKFRKHQPCDDGDIPYAVIFQNGTNIRVKDLLFKNSQRMHLVFSESKNVRASNIAIKAPGDSPNTDGIHITRTTNIEITNSIIGTGDDCISIVNGSKNVKVSRIVCGPGHGISIGSLGKQQELEEHVSNVVVNTVVLRGTTNGVRIKTWQGGKGYARNIVFEDIVMNNVTNPIIVDQFYCDNPTDKNGNVLPCPEKKEAVQVSNVMYRNIRGTSARDLAIRLRCSKTFPCQGILLENVNLKGEGDRVVKAECSNVKYVAKGQFFPRCQVEDNDTPNNPHP